ncbi:MAG: hypothetical protein HKL99_10720 [Burkholderiales bacterium]|nr:hypothetical protein [Burkholderiales bacterium]
MYFLKKTIENLGDSHAATLLGAAIGLARDRDPRSSDEAVGGQALRLLTGSRQRLLGLLQGEPTAARQRMEDVLREIGSGDAYEHWAGAAAGALHNGLNRARKAAHA